MKDAAVHHAENPRSIVYALLAAALYALNAPLSKLLLREAVPPAMMAAFLYLGAGLGMLPIYFVRSRRGSDPQQRLAGHLPYVLAMVGLDIAAPILLMCGLQRTSSANAALLNNFEIVATSLIALLFFGEKISRRLWTGITLMTIASLFLSLDAENSLRFSGGSLLVLLACVCWGVENNCTRVLSHADPLKVVIVKGFGSGVGSLIVALLAGESFPGLRYLPLILLLGFVAYGLSIFFYVYAQRDLGAAKTSSYYAVAPFIGVGLSLIVFHQLPGALFWVALVLMLGGTFLISFTPSPS